MKITCQRRFTFAMGHRLLDHEGECKNLHGHNYIVTIHASAEQLDELGRVIDFAILKDRIGGWLKQHWDHAFTRAENDDLVAQALRITDSKEYVMPYNPTAENIARYLLTEICPRQLADTPVTIEKVVVQETENCIAECVL